MHNRYNARAFPLVTRDDLDLEVFGRSDVRAMGRELHRYLNEYPHNYEAIWNHDVPYRGINFPKLSHVSNNSSLLSSCLDLQAHHVALDDATLIIIIHLACQCAGARWVLLSDVARL